MRELEFVEKLAKLARERPAPRVDVADRVMRSISAEGPPRTPERTWPVTLVLTLAAAACLALAVQSVLELWRPAVELFGSVREVFL